MENDRIESLLPSNNELISRADGWKNYEEKFLNAEEDLEYCFDFVSAAQEEEDDEEDYSETDGSFIEEQEIGKTALVEYFDPKKLFETRLVPLIKKKSLTLTEQIRRMEFHGKVSDWLENNAQHMAEPIFLDNNTPQFPGRFRMRRFSTTEMDFDHSNASSASVDTAAYILSNQRQKISQRTFRMTVKEFCIMEQDTDLLRFEREHPWRPNEIPRRSLAPQYLNDRRCPSIRAPAERLAIEYPQQREESPPTNHHSRTMRSERKRKKPSRFDSSDSDEENSSTSNNQKKPPKRKVCRPRRPQKKATKETSAKDKKETANPTEIVIYKPKRSGYKWNEMVQVTWEMLAAKIGRKDAESLKNHPFLESPIPAASTLVYNIANKRLKEVMGETLISSDEDSDETEEEDFHASSRINQERRENVQEDIVIYEPPVTKRKSRKTIRITEEMLRNKLDKKTFESLTDTPYLMFPFPEASTLLLNSRTKKLYEKFA